MSDFSPSASAAAESGIPVTVGPYADGQQGVRQSLETMALKMREGRLDPSVYAWARRTLAEAGIDGRDGMRIRVWASAILDAVRKQTIYAPDAYGAEVIPSAAATLCLRPDLCLRGDDCDGLAIALGSALLSLGIPTQIVKQNYGGENQEHVFIVFQDERGNWIYADPSTNAPLGQSPRGAVSEIFVNPMEAIGSIPAAQSQIATFGRPPAQKAGVGSFLGWPTVADLIDLTKVAAYNLQQLQAAATTCAAGWPDNAAWLQWLIDLRQCNDAFIIAKAASDALQTTTPHWLQDVNTVQYSWGIMTAVIDQEIDLDRRWRQSNAKCDAPTYSQTPQPQSFDPDLWMYQQSDSAIKGVEAAAKSAVQPLTVGIGGVVVGAVAAIAGMIALDHFFGRRR